jgi:uncharacterized membrane protein
MRRPTTVLRRTGTGATCAGLTPHAAAVAGILGGAGVAHLLNPAFFDAIVPSWVPGSKRLVTYASGVVEIVAAIMVAEPRTRRAGGWLALATFVAVYPANIQAALDGGMKELDPPFDSALAAWVRLPLQIPMFWLAWRVIRGATPAPAGRTGS